MKQSIKKIFTTLNTYLLFLLMISFILMMLTLERQLSFEKINNLHKQQKIINSLTALKKDDIELALIQFNGKSTQLLKEIDKLRSINQYNYSDMLFFKHTQAYLQDLDQLTQLTKAFNEAAHEYYVDDKNETLRETLNGNLQDAFININEHIRTLLNKNVQYDHEKFTLVKYTTIVIFVFVIFSTLYFRKKLFSTYKDIEFLYQIDKSKREHEMYTIEGDAISMRMSRKSTTSDNPALLDPITGINNHKGMLNSYSNKKNLKESNFSSVTILEIDNFSKTKRAFSQELTQAILKKIAYTISLHEQAVDVIARTDYNQFTLILSRASKEQSFKDVELIRQGIEELKFNIPGKGPVVITVSGGFVIKPNNASLDEASRQAKEILQRAKNTGTNHILQTRDLVKQSL